MELTEEQKRIIEQKRLKALKIRQMKEMERNSGSLTPANKQCNSTNLKCLNSKSVISTPEISRYSSQNSSSGTSDMDSPILHKMKKIEANSVSPTPAITQSNVHNSLNPWSLSGKSANSIPAINRPSSQNSSTGTNEVDVKIVLYSRDRVALHFKFQREVVYTVKQFSSAIYNPDSKGWTVDISSFRQLIEKLNDLKKVNIKVKFSDVVPNNVIVALLKQRAKKTEAVDLKEKLNSKFLNEMFNFQKEAVIFGVSRNGRAMIADDMGLGKTVEALALASWYREDWPLLILCPSSLRYQWKKTLLFWIDNVKEHHVVVVDKSIIDISHSRVVIVSYDYMVRMKKKLFDQNFECVIADESHYIKNDTAIRTKVAIEIMKSAKRLFLLTGTPALSRPIELFTQISAIDSRIFSSKTEFGFRYCSGRVTRWGHDFRGSSNTEELKILLDSTIMIRRMKSDVLDQLPSKRRIKIVLPVEFVDNMEYRMKNYSTQLAGMVDNHKSNAYKQLLLQWYTSSAEAKVHAVCEYVRHLVEQDKKFIFFAHHKIFLDTIAEMLEKENCSYIRIDGRTPPKLRLQCCEYFQENEHCKVAIISIVAASVGINLTAAHLVVFAELFWNPGILTQAEDRAHRIGQNDSVLVQYLVSPKTVDDFLWPMISRKFKVLNDVGLTKDNFKDAGITDVNQKLIDDFFTSLPVENSLEL